MTRWTVVFNTHAAQQLEELEAWWRKHRRSAPTQLLDELLKAVDAISQFPEAGQPVDHPNYPTLRRLQLERSKKHVYFLVDTAERTVTIVALWGAQRGSPPDFGE